MTRALPLFVLVVGSTLAFEATAAERDALVAADPLGCVDVVSVDNARSAVDIAAGARACNAAGRYDPAAELMMVSMAFTFFDTRRVRGASAHGAINAMLGVGTAELPPMTGDSLNTAMDALDADAARKVRTCNHLRGLAPPAYPPVYMVEPGRERSVAPGGEALVADFDAAAAWAQALAFVKCTP